MGLTVFSFPIFYLFQLVAAKDLEHKSALVTVNKLQKKNAAAMGCGVLIFTPKEGGLVQRDLDQAQRCHWRSPLNSQALGLGP